MPAMPAARRSGTPLRFPAPTRLTAAFLLGAAAGCGLGGDAAPSLAKLMPSAGYDDAPLALAILGANFRPIYHVDAHSGSATLDSGGFRAWLTSNDSRSRVVVGLDTVVWQSVGLLAAELPAGTPAGPYDLTVSDPRGRSVTLPSAFESLGPDVSAPLVRIVSPAMGTSFAVGASVRIVATAEDGAGTITGMTAVMSSGSGAQQTFSCPVTGGATVSCAFTLPAPGAASTTDELTIDVSATDAAGQVGDARAQFNLVRAPAFDSLSPASGSTLGETQVYIEGAGLMQTAVEVRFDGIPALVRSQGPNFLQVSTPAHPLPGTVPVSVTVAGVTVQKDAGFTYVLPPLVQKIVPTFGPAAGGFPVTVIGDNFVPQTTQIYFGTAPLRCPRYINGNRIEGIAPAGMGTQAVIADDSVSGSVPNQTVPFRYVQDAGAGPFDGGADGGGAGTDAAADAGLDDAGCPGAP